METRAMRRIVVSTFTSLDGVMQAPGGPAEDPTGGFAFGGWTFPHFDQELGAAMGEIFGRPFDLLLGRKTYDIFAAHWPFVTDPNDPIAGLFNRVTKYVASRTLKHLEWNNSTLLRGDVVAAVAALKSEPGPDLQIIGSGHLIQALQRAVLIDEYHVWTFPVVLGRGKRLFEPGAKAGALRLIASRTSSSGVVMSTYVPAGEIRPGSFAQSQPSAKELERRAKWTREGA